MLSIDPNGKLQAAWNKLLANGVSEETLQVVTDINGYSISTLDDIAHAVFGEHLEDLR